MEIKQLAFAAGKTTRTLQRWLTWPGFPQAHRSRHGHNAYRPREFWDFVVKHGKRLRCAKRRGG